MKLPFFRGVSDFVTPFEQLHFPSALRVIFMPLLVTAIILLGCLFGYPVFVNAVSRECLEGISSHLAQASTWTL